MAIRVGLKPPDDGNERHGGLSNNNAGLHQVNMGLGSLASSDNLGVVALLLFTHPTCLQQFSFPLPRCCHERMRTG